MLRASLPDPETHRRSKHAGRKIYAAHTRSLKGLLCSRFYLTQSPCFLSPSCALLTFHCWHTPAHHVGRRDGPHRCRKIKCAASTECIPVCVVAGGGGATLGTMMMIE